MDKKFQQVTIIISSDDLGGDCPPEPLDILCDLIVDSTDVDLISIKDIKDMRLVLEEE
tara:strand:+ start:35 stop:208 length:174 start_codon:yes stop_codon:yes gene_type:complete